MSKIARVIGISVGMMGLLLSFDVPVFAAAAGAISEARPMEIEGRAEYQVSGKGEWKELTNDTVLREKDKIRTEPGAKLWIELKGNDKTAEIEVREGTELKFDTFQHFPEKATEKTLLDVSKGSILVKAEKLRGESTFEVKTPTTVAGIRGTIFEVNVDQEQGY